MDLRSRISSLLRSQLISICSTSTAIIASVLAHYNPPASFPVFMSLLNYTLLTLYYFRPNIDVIRTNISNAVSADYNQCETFADDEISPDWSIYRIFHMLIQMRYPLYIIAAIIDVEASVIILTSFQYTSIVSVVLLDSFAIPCTMLLSFVFLGAKYTHVHIIGTVICVTGLACNVISDYYSSKDEMDSKQNALYGDFLCLFAYLLYATGNVLQEYLVKYVDRGEYLGMLGFWGMLIALIQCFITEYTAVLNAFESANLSMIGLIIGYVSILFLFYVNAAIVIQNNDATYFNLSLLTSDIYALLFAYFVFKSAIHWLYFVSFFLVVIGLLVYHSIAPPTAVNEATTSAHNTVDDVDDENIIERQSDMLAGTRKFNHYKDGKYIAVMGLDSVTDIENDEIEKDGFSEGKTVTPSIGGRKIDGNEGDYQRVS